MTITKSFWQESSKLPRYDSLEADLEVDVLVIGGGFTGIMSAYLIAKEGRKVALVERGRLASVDTGHTTAHLTYVTDTRLSQLAATFGEASACAIWEAGEFALQQVRKIACELKINCDYQTVPGYLHTWKSEADIAELKKDVELANKFGFEADFIPSVPLFHSTGIRFLNQARFHPLCFLEGILLTLGDLECQIFEESEAGEFNDDPPSVKIGRHTIRANKIIVATNNPLSGLSSLLGSMLFQTKLTLYTSYALAAQVPKSLLPDALFWDTRDPYGYLRLEKKEGEDYIIFGGKDHKTGQAESPVANMRALEAEFQSLVPKSEIVFRWSGQVIETHDGIPYIGEVAPNQFIATGYAGNGIIWGALAAAMARDYVLGDKNPWSDLFSPSRKKISSTIEFVKENIDYPYYMLKDRLRSSEGSSLDELNSNEGKLLRLEGKRVAAFKDSKGKVSTVSPVCTHLGCIVAWNNLEKTWDCPCHGSRFKPTGEILSGPAESDLPKIL